MATCKTEQRTIYVKVIAESLQGSASYQMQLGLSLHFQKCREEMAGISVLHFDGRVRKPRSVKQSLITGQVLSALLYKGKYDS